MTNFDLTPNRRNPHNANKWTRYPKDTLPMWVADMDFRAPKPILDALHKAVEHGVLGYEMPSESLKETVAARMDKLYKWKVKPEAVVAVTGIVSGFSVAARIACTPKKGVLVQTPVYNEFHEVKNNIGVPQLDAPFVKRADGNIISYEIDWDIFEKQVKKAGMFLLCNPHNPLGIIFSRKDLLKMAELCIKNNVVIVSDEIHSELLLDGNSFTPMAKLSREIESHTITLIAPSKTFNVPGLFCGFAIIPNEELRKRYEREVSHLRLHVGSMGLFAARAAFSGSCDGWLKDLRRYLTDNRDFLVGYVTEYMPEVRTTIPDATYLGWLDFTQTGMKESPYDFFLKNAKVALSDGKIFGKEGEGHIRLNFGASRALLMQGLDRMQKALEKI
ncbi:MAG: pyridoxal phosphate-dependent aminotransferase [Anaerolineales bacterium]|nr:pyridoxal phosphate-dependent aminotransferase [Anaerolineales bacterium]